jgi:hypothetical protein
MTSAASDPAVPGALGAYPQPNQVAMIAANLIKRHASIFLVLRERGFDRLGDHVFFHGPMAQIDFPATRAAEGHFGIFKLDFFFADRAGHVTANHTN